MTITKENIIRKPVLTEYIPLQLLSVQPCREKGFCRFRQGDNSLLELVFDRTDSFIKQITLLICCDVSRAIGAYRIPLQAEHGDLLIDTPSDAECPDFKCVLYDNAVKVILSDAPTEKVFFSGDIVWDITKDCQLVSVCAVNLSKQLVDHCCQELTT